MTFGSGTRVRWAGAVVVWLLLAPPALPTVPRPPLAAQEEGAGATEDGSPPPAADDAVCARAEDGRRWRGDAAASGRLSADGSAARAGDGSGRADDALRIDTVVVRGLDLFPTETAGRSFVHGVLNDLHVETRGSVIRRELLLRRGERFDCALARETERNLRARGLFREVHVDTSRIDGALALVVTTRDAWTLEPRVDLRVASDGRLAGAVGATERNLAGTGNLLQARYVRDVDRDGIVFGARADRLAGTDLLLAAAYQGLSDRDAAGWSLGFPFRSLSSRWALSLDGEVFDGRVLQYRTPFAAARDTMAWHRERMKHRLVAAWAPIASPAGYVRVGLGGELRREGHRRLAGLPDAEPRAPADTAYGLLEVFVDWRRADYLVLRHLNGFTEEDVDLSRRARVALKLAPASWGYGRTGVGAEIHVQEGGRVGPALLRGRLDATGLVDGAGLDSGRVVLTGSAAVLPAPRHVVFVEAMGGVQRDPAPGQAFDLGFLAGPRLWAPHSFSGTRTARATIEHRWYAVDSLLEALGMGAGAFLDYGGAWYGGDDPRMGGNVGVSLFFGWSLGSEARIGQLAAGYRFGGGRDAHRGSPWAVSLSSGIAF